MGHCLNALSEDINDELSLLFESFRASYHLAQFSEVVILLFPLLVTDPDYHKLDPIKNNYYAIY